MPDLEALGDAATGAMIGRAVEPATGEVSDGHTHERNCLNCGCALTGDYCHCCGQRGHVHRTLGAFFHDLAHGVFHIEGKIWRTLPLLAWKPGELTRRYIDGERARFVSPIALFLFSVFLMFAVAGLAGGLKGPSNLHVETDLTSAVAKQASKVQQLEKKRQQLAAANQPLGKADAKLDEARQELDALRLVQSKGLAGASAMRISSNVPPRLRQMIERGGRNPELVFYKLKTNAYKFSWGLIPLSVPFLWLLFPFSRRFHLYDHTVFVTYSLSFMTLLVVAAVLIGSAGVSSVAAFAIFIPPFHMYRQLRGAYALTRFHALWRTILLSIFAFTAVVLFIMLLVGLGLFD